MRLISYGFFLQKIIRSKPQLFLRDRPDLMSKMKRSVTCKRQKERVESQANMCNSDSNNTDLETTPVAFPSQQQLNNLHSSCFQTVQHGSSIQSQFLTGNVANNPCKSHLQTLSFARNNVLNVSEFSHTNQGQGSSSGLIFANRSSHSLNEHPYTNNIHALLLDVRRTKEYLQSIIRNHSNL